MDEILRGKKIIETGEGIPPSVERKFSPAGDATFWIKLEDNLTVVFIGGSSSGWPGLWIEVYDSDGKRILEEQT